MRFSAAVLTGGASRRMGRDKALIPLGGVPLAQRVVDALAGAGASEVLTIGGDQGLLGELDRVTATLPDDHPGQGPLGGIITALRASTNDVVVVLACDTPSITSVVPRRLAEFLVNHPDHAAVVGVIDDRDQPLTAAWRRSAALGLLERRFEMGERAPRRAFPDLVVGRITDLDPAQVADVDSPEDLDRYAAGEPTTHGDHA